MRTLCEQRTIRSPVTEERKTDDWKNLPQHQSWKVPVINDGALHDERLRRATLGRYKRIHPYFHRSVTKREDGLNALEKRS